MSWTRTLSRELPIGWKEILTLKLEYMRLNDAMPGNPGLKHKVYELNDAMSGNPGFKTEVYGIE